jgi:hypothetical protein
VEVADGKAVTRLTEDIDDVNQFLESMYGRFPTIDRGWWDRTLRHDGTYAELLFERS